LRQHFDRVTPESLARLNREALRDWSASHGLSRPLLCEGTVLHSGINCRNEPRVAAAERVDGNEIHPRAKMLDTAEVTRVLVSVELGGERC
jgi:hypothetical protein